jgi:hypothetical protein
MFMWIVVRQWLSASLALRVAILENTTVTTSSSVSGMSLPKCSAYHHATFSDLVTTVDKIYSGNNTITIYPPGTEGENITSLAAAWSLIEGKLLTEPITIQFLAGTYPTPNMIFSHPNSNMISILVCPAQHFPFPPSLCLILSI